MKINPADIKRIEWVKSFKSGEKWFLKLRKQYGLKMGTQKNYALGLKRFCEYISKNPDEIIADYKDALAENVEAGVSDWNDNLDLFVPWAIDKYGLSRSRARDHFTAVKSFFEHNSSIGLSAKTPNVRTISLTPTPIDAIREKILSHADINTRFIVIFLKDSGMSQDDALRLNIGDIDDLGNGFGYIKTYRAKEGVDYETWVGPNTMEALKQYLDYRKRNGGDISESAPLFVKKTKIDERLTSPLIGYMLRDLGKRADEPLSTHRLRKTFETFLALGRVHPIILKYWMGHTVKGGKGDIEARYIIPPKNKQLEAYMEAYQNIDISGQSLGELQRRQQVAEGLTDKLVRGESFTDEDRANVKRYGIRLKERAGRPKPADNADCPNGKNCPVFEEIGEEALLEHLRNGWSVTHNLQNGRVIVSIER